MCPTTARTWRRLRTVGAATLTAAAMTACGESAIEVPTADQRAIFEAFVDDAQPLFRQDCRSVGRPVSDRTLGAYATLLRIARRDPRSILQSPDFVDVRWPASGYVVDRLEDITYCIDHSTSANGSWRQLKARLGREVAAMAASAELRTVGPGEADRRGLAGRSPAPASLWGGAGDVRPTAPP